MREVVILFLHLIVAGVRLARPGGLGSVVAESLLVKHQLRILNRGRKRAPNLRTTERFIAGVQGNRARRMRMMKSAGLRRIGMAIVALTAVACAQVAPKKEEKRTPIVTDGMTTGEFGQILEKARAMEEAKSCGRRMWEEGKPFSLEELAGTKVKMIQVVRAENYKISPAPKPEQARATIEQVWSRKFGWMACQIEWDEGVRWSVEAELEFEDGKKGALITDGWHVAIQDDEGHSWFVR